MARSRRHITDTSDDEASSSSASASYSQTSYIRIFSEDDLEFDLAFATDQNACKESRVHVRTGRRYAGEHPIGG